MRLRQFKTPFPLVHGCLAHEKRHLYDLVCETYAFSYTTTMDRGREC